jgi:3-hydroxyacyl-[acyl-carrier protein] dehydratase / trans-2-decenoyl-[acyl-carrier protein] isomerase
VLPDTKCVTYHISVKRVINRQLVLGIADGVVKADDRTIYEAQNLRVGLFTSPESF